MSNSVLLTAGIGDFVAIDSFLDKSTKNNIKKVFYATRAYKPIQELINSCKDYNVEHINLWDNYDKFSYFLSKSDVKSKLVSEKVYLNNEFEEAKDLSIFIYFQTLTSNLYQECPFVKSSLCSIDKFDLNFKYITVSSYSLNEKLTSPRNFTNNDWQLILKFSRKYKVPLVVIGLGDFYVPKESNIIDLSNKTKFSESIEILKNGYGYWGIDSVFSVFATKIFPANRLLIKTVNSWCLKSAHIYFAPFTKFPFLGENLEKIFSNFPKISCKFL